MIVYEDARGVRAPHPEERERPKTCTRYAEFAATLPHPAGEPAISSLLSALTIAVEQQEKIDREKAATELGDDPYGRQALAERQHAATAGAVLQALRNHGAMSVGRLSALTDKNRTTHYICLVALEKQRLVRRVGKRTSTRWLAV